MSSSKIAFGLLAVATAVCVAQNSWSADSEALEKAEREYREHWARLEASGKAHDLDGLRALADEVETRWAEADKERYGYLMLGICNALKSPGFREKGHSLAREYAMLALRKSSGLPLLVVFKLLLRVEADWRHFESLDKADWSTERSAKVQLWLQAWKRVEEGFDRNWDPNKPPPWQVSPPAATGLPAGVGPEAVQDPKLRAEYEAAIEANRKKWQWYKSQQELRELKQHYLPWAEYYIVSAYSRPPSDVPGLEGYLQNYLSDEEAKTRILDGVRASMAEHPGQENGPGNSDAEGG